MGNSYITKEKNFVSVVTYLYNAEDHVRNYLHKLDVLLNERFEAYEFIFVNDYSTDNAVGKIKQIANEINGKITIINLAWKHNKELAMLAGVDMAIGDFVYEFETTVMDYDIQDVWNIYEESMKGYDVVAATSDQPIKFTSKLFYKFLNRISYRKMSLTTETFRIISRRALNRVLKSQENLRYRKALYHYSGLQTEVFNYKRVNKEKIASDMDFKEKISLSTDVLIGFSNVGTKIASYISALFFLSSICAGIYAINAYLTLDSVEPGWTTTMLFLSASFTGVFLILSIVTKYLVLILNEVQNRAKYTYKTVEKL